VSAVLLSFVIPTLNESDTLPALLNDLRRVRVPHEIIVADGGSIDGTERVATADGATVVAGPGGRGRQLRLGAATARGELLCFLHADVRVGDDARAAIERAVADEAVGAVDAIVFSLRIAAADRIYRVVERAANLRTRLAGLPYGDQGLLVSRDMYVRAGGFRDIPLMEDVAMVRSLRQHTRIRLLPACLEVSPRRWERDGAVRRTVRNCTLLVRYLLGASPERLAAAYEPHSGASVHHADQSAAVSISHRWSRRATRKPAAAAADDVAASVSAELHGTPSNRAG
jgi:hypothetical protein